MGQIKSFMKLNYRHFNSAVTVDAAEAWIKLIDQGGKMFLAMAGAMSTAELGISLAEMIRKGKIHGICTTGANLEEDIYNLVAHKHYKRIPGYRSLQAQEELDLRENGFNRVTDTCIPEEEAIRRIEESLLKVWQKADTEGKSYFPYEYLYQMIDSGELKQHYEGNPEYSWVLAAHEKKIPIYTPGWEDSTCGNVFVAHNRLGNIKRFSIVKSGAEQMNHFIDWYLENTSKNSMGFFQIGGGIAGDFPICVVPLIHQDLQKDCKLWGYFCQISDSTTSYGSHSGAVPNEKISWGKLGKETPRFIIESDASIVAPLIFNYVLGN